MEQRKLENKHELVVTISVLMLRNDLHYWFVVIKIYWNHLHWIQVEKLVCSLKVVRSISRKLTLNPIIFVFYLILEPTGVKHEHCSTIDCKRPQHHKILLYPQKSLLSHIHSCTTIIHTSCNASNPLVMKPRFSEKGRIFVFYSSTYTFLSFIIPLHGHHCWVRVLQPLLFL